MQLSDIPVELLCWCVQGSDGRVRRTCSALRDAFDEIARVHGVDLPLVGWRCADANPERVGLVPAIGALRVRPTEGRDEYDLEVTNLACAAVLDASRVRVAVEGGAARVKAHAPRFGQFKYKSTKHTLAHATPTWYDKPAICVERAGCYVRLVVQGCNATEHQRWRFRYFTVAHACDGLVGYTTDDTSVDKEVFRRLGPRILAAKRFCDRLVKY
jgi:hypothetical protein